MSQLVPCVWFRLLCTCGECYVALPKGAPAEAECPKCHTLTVLELVCGGMTASPLPRFGRLRLWTTGQMGNTNSGKTLKQDTWFGGTATGFNETLHP